MMAAIFWDRKGIFFDIIRGIKDHNNVIGLLWNAEYIWEVDPKQTARDAH